MEDFEKLPKMAGWPGSDLVVPTGQLTTIESIKPNHNITFHRQSDTGRIDESNKVGSLDFNGPALKFEGNAEESAILFFNWVAQIFDQRLKDEYQRGYNDAKKENT